MNTAGPGGEGTPVTAAAIIILTRMRRRPSPATVISLIALFVALGGTSYAVVKLPAASVGNRELKANAVSSAKIRDGSVHRTDLAADARSGGLRGPRGPEGPVGAAGPAGPGSGPPEAWRSLPFAGTWTNYSGGHATAAYRRDANGVVWLRGFVTKNVGTPAVEETIGRLPVGYRPPERLMFAAAMGRPDAYGRIDVHANGDVNWAGGPAGEVDYTSLDTIRFWTN